MTNTYKPIVGGLERSVETFTGMLRSMGHKVLIVSLKMKDAPREKDVFRLPAIQNFKGTNFSIEIPVSRKLFLILNDFKPDIIHSHHPFLIGDTALRISASLGLPLIFTNHSLYEKNTHYLPMDSTAMKRFVIKLSVGYANLCDYVIAPSRSIADLLIKRGVKTPVDVVPSGINLDDFKDGDGSSFRGFYSVPQDAFLAGVASRIAEEKNIRFLASAVARFLESKKNAYFAVIGSGPELVPIQKYFQRQHLKERIIFPGVLKGKQLASAYSAMNVFVFSSHSETQGLVLVEAMAAGVPVVAVDAPGVKEVVIDKVNGRLIKGDKVDQFHAALSWISELKSQERGDLIENAKKTARDFSVPFCAQKLLKIYGLARQLKPASLKEKKGALKKTFNLLKAEKNILLNMTKAAGWALFGPKKKS